jgi:uncharacterized membrane protein YkvA (DUF1232 family)
MMAAMTLERWKKWARELKTQTYALYFAMKDSRVPWYAKLLAGGVAAYAASPIDLIPDFIPLLGYIDDLIIVPLGVAFVVKMIPPEIWAECRAKAARGSTETKFLGWAAAVVIVIAWIIVAAWVAWKIFGRVK